MSTQIHESLSTPLSIDLITPFYEMLNHPAQKDLKTLSNLVLLPDWKSYSNDTTFKTRDEFIAQLEFFGKVIPDLTWQIINTMMDGNRIIVRSECGGTPVGPFLGVTPTGKSFKIMAIDIHTFQFCKAITSHHVEDWAGAIRQLSSQ